MIYIVVALLLLAGVLVRTLPAQARYELPAAAVHAGVGGHQGWIGVAGELYFVPGRFSILAGAGVLPIWGGQFAWAGALRCYAAGKAGRHRPFVDVSWTLLEVSQPSLLNAPVAHTYGPGLMVGYRYTAGSGFTLTGGAGLARPARNEVLPLVLLAAGWTWRR